jgi:pimeloyl-ACP methyl ester carboxylesterase
MTIRAMQMAKINGARLELFDSGRGEPVMFVHGAGSIGCHATLDEPMVVDRFRVLHYHRRGFGKSESRDGPSSIALEAADCRAVLTELGIERAHFAGLSGGASILLKYAADYPDTVQSLALFEPPLPEALANSPEFAASGEKAAALYQAGNLEGVADTFLSEVDGADYKAKMGSCLPDGWFAQMVDDAPAVVEQDIPWLFAWTSAKHDIEKITAPVLNVVGADSRSYFHDGHETIKSWIPHAESVVMPDATHGMLVSNPAESAALLADFFERHPIQQ